MALEIVRLRAVGSDGRAYVILAITPVDTLTTYHSVRKEYGRVRHELNDGTAVIQLSATRFQIAPGGEILELVQA